MRGLSPLVAASVAVVAVALVGCGGDPAKPQVNPDDYVQKKLDAMDKIAALAESGADEPSVIDALEEYRGIPFLPKQQPEAARKILDTYKKRVAPKVKGDAALQLKGDMNLLEHELK